MAIRTKRFDDPAAEASQFLIRLGLAVLAIAVPLAAIFARRSIFLLFPLGAGVILVGALLSPRRDGLSRIFSVLRSPMGAVAALVVFWAALSIIWAPVRGEAVERLFKVAGTMSLAAAAAALLPDKTRTANLYLAPIGVAAATLVTLVLAARGQLVPQPSDPTAAIDRAMIAVSLLTWPALAILIARRRVGAAIALTVLVALACVFGASPVAIIALGAGGLAYAATLGNQKLATRALGWVFAGVVMLAPLVPFAVRAAAEHGWTSRVEVTGAAGWLTDAPERPLRLVTGRGLDAAAQDFTSGRLPAGAPRTALFDIWYELGVLGAAGVAAMLWGAFRVARYAPASVGPALAGGLTHGLLIGATGVGTAQVAWLTFLAVAAILFTAMVNGLYETSRPVAPSQMRPVIPPGLKA